MSHVSADSASDPLPRLRRGFRVATLSAWFTPLARASRSLTSSPIALAANPDAQVAFDALEVPQQQQLAEHVDDAKQPDTRQRRAAKAVEELPGTPA